MLLPPMNDYRAFITTYARPSDPPTYNYADVIDGYGSDPARKALIWTNDRGEERRFTFREISEASQRIANVLRSRGIGRGDRVIVMLPRIPEWQMTMIALFRIGAVSLPSLTMLTPKDLQYRIEQTQPKAVIAVQGETHKFDGLLDKDCVRLTVRYGAGEAIGWEDLVAVMAEASPHAKPEAMTRKDPGIIYFTSGSTGMPKGVTHSAYFAYSFLEIAAYWFDLNEQCREDICWGTADTGWAFSATCTLIGPWVAGVCAFTYDGPFDPKVRLQLIERYGITLFAATASEYRWMLGENLANYDLSKLRLSITAGEALDAPTAYRWMDLTRTRIHESYGQTESFMSVANFPMTEIKPGSMGLPMPGMPVDIIDEESYDPIAAGQIGHVALRVPFHGQMLGYWNDPVRTDEIYRTNAAGERWLITGDLGRKDEDGYLWYEGRSDDVINAAGYRIGPTEVESVIMAHPAVREVAAVASPDEKRGVVVKAFIVLNEGYRASDSLVREIQDHVKAQTAPYKYPRRIEFVGELPKTVSGKVKRKELRDLESARSRAAVG
ncbi:acyl-CoA synthetase [Bradyrhizobium liaoningense]